MVCQHGLQTLSVEANMSALHICFTADPSLSATEAGITKLKVEAVQKNEKQLC